MIANRIYQTRYLIVFILLQWVSGLFAQNALLWEIQTKDKEVKGWLFGTIHLIPEKDYIWPEIVQRCLDQSESVYLELNMEDATNPMAQAGLFTRMMLPGDTTLRDLLDEKDYRTVEQELAKSGLPIALVEKIKPMFLSVLLEQNRMPSSEEMLSYDWNIFEYASRSGIPHHGLETMEEQLAAFDAVPLTVQASMLVDALAAPEDGQDPMMEVLVAAWKSEDLGRLQELIQSQQGLDDDIMARLLDDRNHRWIPRMQEAMSKGKVFFGVGAGHLAGPHGVLKLLENTGFRLQPIAVFR